METIVPKAHYEYLYKSSFLTLISLIYALYRGYYYIALYPTGILITSLNYWRYPTNGWRRYLDITVVTSSLTHHLIIAYRAENANYFYIISVAALCYPLGWYLQDKNPWAATRAHSAMHLIGNIAAVVLYRTL